MRVVRRGGKRVRVARIVRMRAPGDDDVLVLDTAEVQLGDNTPARPLAEPVRLAPSRERERVNAPETIGTAPAQPFIRASARSTEPTDSRLRPPGAVLLQATGAQAVTIRVKGLERILCRTQGGDTITETLLGRRGNAAPSVRTTTFAPEPGTKLAAMVG